MIKNFITQQLDQNHFKLNSMLYKQTMKQYEIQLQKIKQKMKMYTQNHNNNFSPINKDSNIYFNNTPTKFQYFNNQSRASQPKLNYHNNSRIQNDKQNNIFDDTRVKTQHKQKLIDFPMLENARQTKMTERSHILKINHFQTLRRQIQLNRLIKRKDYYTRLKQDTQYIYENPFNSKFDVQHRKHMQKCLFEGKTQQNEKRLLQFIQNDAKQKNPKSKKLKQIYQYTRSPSYIRKINYPTQRRNNIYEQKQYSHIIPQSLSKISEQSKIQAEFDEQFKKNNLYSQKNRSENKFIKSRNNKSIFIKQKMQIPSSYNQYNQSELNYIKKNLTLLKEKKRQKDQNRQQQKTITQINKMLKGMITQIKENKDIIKGSSQKNSLYKSETPKKQKIINQSNYQFNRNKLILNDPTSEGLNNTQKNQEMLIKNHNRLKYLNQL